MTRDSNSRTQCQVDRWRVRSHESLGPMDSSAQGLPVGLLISPYLSKQKSQTAADEMLVIPSCNQTVRD